MSELKSCLIEEIDEIQDHCGIDVGYFTKRPSDKIKLVRDADLTTMYAKFKTGSEIELWCDMNDEMPIGTKRKRKTITEVPSKRQTMEEEVDDAFRKLRDMHGTDYEVTQLRLWARMIQCGTHDSYEDPPNVPMIIGIPPKRSKENFSESLANAAVAIVKALSPPPPEKKENSDIVRISPAKKCDLRMRNLEQLRYIQQLYEDKILSEQEFLEQKDIILTAIRRIT